MRKLHNIYGLREHRKELRKNKTPQEEKLWWYLRRNQLGVKFRSQHSIGGYVVDFYCAEKRLIIEIDGEIHKKTAEYDKVRTLFLKQFNFEILRFSNVEIENNIEMVLGKIKEKL